MTTKPDFAQKLLNDLRVRKERMAATQSSSRQSSQTSRVTRGNSGHTSRGARQINVLDSTGSTTGNTSRRSTGGSRSVNIKESSSQIVLYEGGQSSKQVRDLSMAIAFAFENSGNLSSMGGSSSNPLVNFFNRFGRRSSNSRRMETSCSYSHSAAGQFPTVSNIHINEISKGVHKLNKILSASNGLNLDRNSIEIGRELLKGAVNLEESLRMLVNLQDSEYTNGFQKKSRIKLLEEDEDDEDDNEKRVEQWKLGRPRFSFDKTSGDSRVVQGATRRRQLALPYKHETSEQPVSNSEMVPHKRSNSYVQDFSLSMLNSSSSKSTQEKGRISNVIAKLMGLEEVPVKEGSISGKIDPKEKERKQGKVSRESTKQNIPLTRESRNRSDLSTSQKLNTTCSTLTRRESKLQNKPEKSQETLDGGSRMVNSERSQPRKDLKTQVFGMEAASDSKPASVVMEKQQNHSNHANGLKSLEDSIRKQTQEQDKQSKSIEIEGKMLALNAEQQKQAPNSKMLKAGDRSSDKIGQEVISTMVEKRKGNNYLAKNQQKSQDQRAPLPQEQVPKIPDHSVHKSAADQKLQQLQNPNLVAKHHEGQQAEHINAPKSKRSTAMTLQKKLPREKSVPGDGRSINPNEKVPMKDPANKRHQDASVIIDDVQKTAANQESPQIEGKSHNSFGNESEPQIYIEKGNNLPLAEEKPIEVPAIQKKIVAGKVQRREIPEKLEVLMTRKSATRNHLTRSTTRPANMLKDLKKQMQNKNRESRKMEEPSDSKVKEGKELVNTSNAAEIVTELEKPDVKLETEDDRTIILDSTGADELQNQNRQNKLNLNDKSESTASNSIDILDDLQTEEKTALKDEEELKHCVQSIETHEESTELDLLHHGYTQFPAFNRQEQLTEPEKDLKETVIKSQMFLSTAEALFKLNIPVSLLHSGDHENHVSGRKLMLDSAHEVMKRKARRHEFTCNPYMKATISNIKLRSLDDLIKKLCKDLEMLKTYGMNGSDECDVAAGLHKMLNKDIYNEVPDVNCMWDFEWSRMTSIFPEMEDVVKNVERQMLNGLLDEITTDLLSITVSV